MTEASKRLWDYLKFKLLLFLHSFEMASLTNTLIQTHLPPPKSPNRVERKLHAGRCGRIPSQSKNNQ